MKNANVIWNPQNYQFLPGEHHGKHIIWVRFPYDKNLITALREVAKAYWSASKKSWYVTDNLFNRNLFCIEPEIVGKKIRQKISAVNLPQLEKYHKILSLKGFSPNTIRTYSTEFSQLLYLIGDFPVENLTAEKLQSYFLYCIKELKLSENLIHCRINAIKFYYEKVLHQEKMFFDIPRPKKPLLLPKSLNTDEIKALFAVVENMKHRLILRLCYGMGLRVSEIINLRVSDIDSKRMLVLISRGKGKKDRYVNLPKSVLNELREYYRSYKPQNYLFEGYKNGPYSGRSVQKIFKDAMLKAGIRKNIGIHGLRHSYATHLLEFGTDISIIQKLLGHNDIKTTLIYTKVSDKQIRTVESPLDRI